MANALIDSVGKFSIRLFRGNPFKYILKLGDNVVLPTSVELKSFYNKNFTGLLPDNLQGTVTLDANNRTLTFEYPVGNYPVEGAVQLLWNGRVVNAGPLLCNTDTVDKVALSGVFELIVDKGEVISVPYTGDFLTAQFRSEALSYRDQSQAFRNETENFAGIATDAANTATEQAESIQNVLTQYVLLTTLQSYSTTSQMNTVIQNAINTLVGSAPGMLDTLNEIAAAIGNDPNFSTTILNSLAGKPTVQTVANVAALNAAASGPIAKLLICLSDPGYDDSESTLNMWTGSKLKIFIAQDR